MDDDMRSKKVGEMIADSMSTMIGMFNEIEEIKDEKKRKQALVAVLAVVQISRDIIMDIPWKTKDMEDTPEFKL